MEHCQDPLDKLFELRQARLQLKDAPAIDQLAALHAEGAASREVEDDLRRKTDVALLQALEEGENQSAIARRLGLTRGRVGQLVDRAKKGT